MPLTNRPHRNRKTKNLKAKRSYTLSTASVAFLEALRKKRRAPSVSSVLDAILQAARREQGKAAVERAVTDYYASLSSAEAAEQTAWGEFALGEFPKDAV